MVTAMSLITEILLDCQAAIVIVGAILWLISD